MTNLTTHEAYLVEQATAELRAQLDAVKAAAASATWALHQAERKLRHLAQHYHGRSARELYDAADCAAKASAGLDAAVCGC
jgi:hypothetical protein